MSAAVSIILAYPPSANRLWRKAGSNIIRSDEYSQWLNLASWVVRGAVLKTGDRKGVLGPYALYVRLCPPDRRARDLDNTLKALSDALKTGGAIEGDHLCQYLEAQWDPSVEGANVCVMETQFRIPPSVKAKRRRSNRGGTDDGQNQGHSC
jgi:crossover junction endodeoxyribonuclease RusA